jgi:glucan phosphoethanolaminetransferase (alkaline phosphatase superfamily)
MKMKEKTDSSKIMGQIPILVVFSLLLAFTYMTLTFFATWGDWTDGYYHQGHPEWLVRDMISNSHAAGVYAGMYIVIQQILAFKYLKSVKRRIRLLAMAAILISSFVFTTIYSNSVLRNVEDNVMHLPQVIQYPGTKRP